MLKLLFLTAILATVSANVLEKYVGDIIPVVMYPIENNIELCYSFDMSISKKNCTCDGSTVPVLIYDVCGDKSKVPVKIVESETEALDALVNECQCNKKTSQPAALVPFNDNYFIIYAKDSPTDFTTILFAKNKPSPKELNDFINSTDGLKDKSGDIVCTTDSVDLDSLDDEEQKESSVSKIKKSFVKN